MTIRVASPDDYAALAGVQRRAVDECLRPLYDAPAVDSWLERLDAAKFERVVASGEEIVVAEVDGAVVGFASFHAEMSSIGMWYVDPAFIGQGIGSRLLAHAETGLIESGCLEATTEASLFARPMFESRGWLAVEEYEKPAFGGTFQVTRMRKLLAG